MAMKGAHAAATIRYGLARKSQPVPVNVDGLIIAYMFVVFALTAAVAIGLARYMRSEPAPTATTTPFSIGETKLNVPDAWLRLPRHTQGPVTRIELAIPWPSETDRLDADPTRRAQTPALEDAVLVSLVMADGAVAPADRPAKLYARFLTPDAWPNPGGLVLRRFKAQSPYENEDLYVSPPDGRAFSARCPRSDATSPVHEGCIAEIRIGGLDALVEFSPSRLVQWKQLADGIRRAVETMVPAQ
jgi:hypothetical protein